MGCFRFAIGFLLSMTPLPGNSQDCSGTSDVFPTPDTSSVCMTNWPGNTVIEYPDGFQGILNKVEIYKCEQSDKRIIISNGVPDHRVTVGNRPNAFPCEIPYAVELPLNPVVAASVSEIPIRGMIAMAKNGVPAFGPQEISGTNAVEADPNLTNVLDAGFWYGHAGRQNGWHVHNPHMGKESVASDSFLGYALDGFPIYGPLSDSDAGELDECNGVLVDGSYRYHVRSVEQVDNTTDYCSGSSPIVNWNYILGCYSGSTENSRVSSSTTFTLPRDCVLETDDPQIAKPQTQTPTEENSPKNQTDYVLETDDPQIAKPQTQTPTEENSPKNQTEEKAPKNPIKRPNIIIMQPDDLVFMEEWGPPPNNPGTDGSTNEIPSAGMPHIEALRAGGLHMTQAYSVSPVCGTSRYSTITGKMPSRAGTVRDNDKNEGENPALVTIPTTKLVDTAEQNDCSSENLAAAFSDADYATGMVGKWHLSKIDRSAYTYDLAVDTVKQCGFDFVGGLYIENLDRNADETNLYSDGTFSHNMEWITYEAISFINETVKADNPQPFFLYFNPTVPHASQNVLDAIENFSCRDTADPNFDWNDEDPYIKEMSEEGCEAYRTKLVERANGGTDSDYNSLGKLWLDDSVGALLQALKDNGVYEDTIFVFQEDHGMDPKKALFEGGIRIPQFIHYPAGINAGTIFDAPVSTVDIAATMMDYAGIETPPYELDGMSWKNVIGNPLKESYWKNDRCIFFENEQDRAVRCGCYKYLDIRDDTSSTYAQGNKKGLANDIGGMLFDLCDGGDDYITDNSNNREEAFVDDNNTKKKELEDNLGCHIKNTNPEGVPMFSVCGEAMSELIQTDVPVPSKPPEPASEPETTPEITIAPKPVCKDDPTYRLMMEHRNCEWIGMQPDERCARKDNEPFYKCPEACGNTECVQRQSSRQQRTTVGTTLDATANGLG